VARVEVKLESVINGQGGLKSEVSKAKNWKCSTCENKESLLPELVRALLQVPLSRTES